MKKLISGILCTALLATCFCGCKKSSEEKKGMYLLRVVVKKNEAGEVLSRENFEYNDKGLVTAYVADLPRVSELWDEEAQVYRRVEEPCDGTIDEETTFRYDEKGNAIYTKVEKKEPVEFEYFYNDEGKIDHLSYASSTKVGRVSCDIELRYYDDGTIEAWNTDPNQQWRPMERWETSDGRVDKLEYFAVPEGDCQHTFEYDADGDLIDYVFTSANGSSAKGTRSYDKNGRVTSEQGFRPGENAITYQYSGDQLVSINDEKLNYQEQDNGDVVVTYQNFEMTYEWVWLTKEEIALAHYRWNQFCGGFASDSSYWRGMYGVEYPVFDTNTVLLLPKSIYEQLESKP